MINGINGMGASTAMMQGPPPPRDKDVFQLSDSDGDGVVSQTELESLVEKIEEVSGTALNAEENLNTYDANGDGGLSGEELFEMLSSNGLVPTESPPPAQLEQAIAAYGEADSSDPMAQLLELLNGESADESYRQIDVNS